MISQWIPRWKLCLHNQHLIYINEARTLNTHGAVRQRKNEGGTHTPPTRHNPEPGKPREEKRCWKKKITQHTYFHYDSGVPRDDKANSNYVHITITIKPHAYMPGIGFEECRTWNKDDNVDSWHTAWLLDTIPYVRDPDHTCCKMSVDGGWGVAAIYV